jgi:RNA polymerase sigma factor (sigma-70 family)
MSKQKRSPGKRPYMMAMVLGTALSALGPAVAQARHQVSDQSVSAVSRYCSACWRNANLPVDRWGDCTQEVLRRLLERVEPARWGMLFAENAEERREFIRAIDAVRKRTQRERGRTILLTDATDVACADSPRVAEERAAVTQASGELLSHRQNQILQMAMDGWSVQEMAVALSLSPERISDEKYKAIRKLRAHFASAS